MTEREKRDLQEDQEQRKSNNELFNLALNRCENPRQVYNALLALVEEVHT